MFRVEISQKIDFLQELVALKGIFRKLAAVIITKVPPAISGGDLNSRSFGLKPHSDVFVVVAPPGTARTSLCLHHLGYLYSFEGRGVVR